MLQQTKPDDYVIATGKSYTVKHFCEKAFAVAGINLIWDGTGVNEKGVDKNSGNIIVEIDPQYFRPVDVEVLIGDARKAEKVLGWEPKVKLNELIEIMVEHDMKLFANN